LENRKITNNQQRKWSEKVGAEWQRVRRGWRRVAESAMRSAIDVAIVNRGEHGRGTENLAIL